MELSSSNGEKNQFEVILLGVIFDTKTRKILIGRRENNPHIKELTWVFPGGRLRQEDADIEKALEEKIKHKTGLNVKNLGAVFSRIPEEKNNLLIIYYLCELVDGKEQPNDDLVELKWVSPEDVESHFTTSFHPRLKEYILNLK